MANTAIHKIVSLTAPTYRNTTKVFSLAGVDGTLWDATKVALAARLNLGLYGGAGMGKSQLLADVQSLVGNNASYVLGRNDLDIKALFRQLNFHGLKEAMDKGGQVSQADLTNVTDAINKPLVVVEEINRAVEAVQNQLFNIFEGFIELDGHKYSLGGTELQTFRDFDGREWSQNVRYSVGVWSANYGNGQYTGTVSMDKALKERSHLIIDVDNFSPLSADLDGILLGSGGEIRLKEQEKAEDRTKDFVAAFQYLKQKSHTPSPKELGLELLLFRYLVQGLDYLPCSAANNSKRLMKDVWPAKAEGDNIGNDDDEKLLYRTVFPASVRGAMTIMTLARALREYVNAKDTKAKPTVLDSVAESFKLVAAYSGMLENPQRIRENYVGNPYRAAVDVGNILKKRLSEKKNLMDAIIHCKAEEKPLTREIINECKGEYACFL
ncbi:MAG: AAA family ATPase [Nanoarchaeota archaeon]